MLREQLSQQEALEGRREGGANGRESSAQSTLPLTNNHYGSLSSNVVDSSTPANALEIVPPSHSKNEHSSYGENEEDEEGDYLTTDNEDDDDEGEESEVSYEDSSVDEEHPMLKNKRRKRSYECTKLEPVLRPLKQLYNLVRDAVILVTNTDDVWDSPAYEHTSDRQNVRYGSVHSQVASIASSHGRRGQHQRGIPGWTVDDELSLNQEKHVSFQHKIVVMFWFLVLAIFYAIERSSFKIMVDRMGPFRMVVGGEIIVATHAVITGTWMALCCLCGKFKKNKVMLPIADILVMAMLDAIQLLLCAISASHVAPILTAILVHVTIPFTTFINTCKKRNCGDSTAQSQSGEEEHSMEGKPQTSQLFFGSTLILLSSILGLAPAVLTLSVPTVFPSSDLMADRTALNTILFVGSYIPGAISQSYKEQALSSFAQPVDPDLLNFILSIFSACFAFVVSPLFYPLQGIADMPSLPGDETDIHVKNWIHQYPSKNVSQNFKDGLQCFTGTLSDEKQIRGYPEEAHCDFAYGFVILHVCSIIVISHAVGKICSAGAFKIMHKGISAGIILSVVSLFIYQVFVDDMDYGVIPNVYHISCAAVLVMGSEVYHRVTLEMPSFETEYPPINIIYDE